MSAGCVVQFDTDSAIALTQVRRLPLQVFFSFALRAFTSLAFSHRNSLLLVWWWWSLLLLSLCLYECFNRNKFDVYEAVNVCIFLYIFAVLNLIVYKRIYVTYIIIFYGFILQIHTCLRPTSKPFKTVLMILELCAHSHTAIWLRVN